MSEIITWKKSPSHFLNLGIYLSGIFLITIPFVFLRWKSLRSTICEITDTKVHYRSSFVFKEDIEIKLDEITNVYIEKSFFLNLFSLSNLIISSSISDREIIFPGIKKAEKAKKHLIKLINNKI